MENLGQYIFTFLFLLIATVGVNLFFISKNQTLSRGLINLLTKITTNSGTGTTPVQASPEKKEWLKYLVILVVLIYLLPHSCKFIKTKYHETQIASAEVDREYETETGTYMPVEIKSTWYIDPKDKQKVHITVYKGFKTGPIYFNKINRWEGFFPCEIHAGTGSEILSTFNPGNRQIQGFVSGSWYFSSEKYFLEHPNEKSFEFWIRTW